MKITIEQIDLVKTRSRWPAGYPFEPARIKTRKKLENLNWTVLVEKHINGCPPSWAYAHHDDYVRIPLFEYDLPIKLDLALSYLLSMGLSCAASLQKDIRRLHIVTGVPVEILFNENKNEDVGIRYWFGFAVVTE
jgi:hypothetical protein